MNKKFILFGLIFCILLGVLYFLKSPSGFISKMSKSANIDRMKDVSKPYPLSIDSLRQGVYPGSDLVIKQTLEPGSNYSRQIASYQSEGLKIYGLLTIPDGTAPAGGWPAIIFNHGFIPPDQYATTEKYVAYQDNFAHSGYVTFKSDYRGHGESEGDARGGYGSNDYTIDVLNATSSVKRLKDVNKNKIGMWGHSMGGFITLRNMVVDPGIKAGVIWGGVVGSYDDLLYNWHRSPATVPSIPRSRTSWRNSLLGQYGSPKDNPTFWNSLSANSYLKDISGPIQLHHSTTDEEVPVAFSQKLFKQLKDKDKDKDKDKEVELYEYPGDDHNITVNFILAAQRSLDFFDKYLKQ